SNTHLPLLPPTKSSPLALHDALPISTLKPPERFLIFWSATDFGRKSRGAAALMTISAETAFSSTARRISSVDRTRVIRGKSKSVDRKSTRLNSSHSQISYAVFCLKKK